MTCPKCKKGLTISRMLKHSEGDSHHICSAVLCTEDCGWGKWYCQIDEEEMKIIFEETKNGNIPDKN